MRKLSRDAGVVIPFVILAALLLACNDGQRDSSQAKATGTLVGTLTPSFTPTPTSPAPPTPSAVPTVHVSGCRLGAAFVRDVTIPDGTRMRLGTTFTKTWAIRNTGTCKWIEGYRLVRITRDNVDVSYDDKMGAPRPGWSCGPDFGDDMGAPDYVQVPETEPGEIVEVSVPMKAPDKPGEHCNYWRMCVNDKRWFGSIIYAQITSVEADVTITTRDGETILLDSERQLEIVLFYLHVWRVLGPADVCQQSWKDASKAMKEGRLGHTDYYIFLERASEAYDSLLLLLWKIPTPQGLEKAASAIADVLIYRSYAMKHLTKGIDTWSMEEVARGEKAYEAADAALLVYMAEVALASLEAGLPFERLNAMVVCDEATEKCWLVSPD